MEEKNQVVGILLGMLLLACLHVFMLFTVVLFLAFLAQQSSSDPYAGLGFFAWSVATLFLWQIIYVIPAVRYYRKKEYLAVSNGLIIGAVITALLNGSCSVLMFTQ